MALVLYALFAFMSLQTNPLKWDAVTRAVFTVFFGAVGAIIYLDMDVRGLIK